MKKKNLKNLELYKYKISNLHLLHQKAGGQNGGTNTTTLTTATETATGSIDTNDMNPTEETYCYSDCNNCGTNGGSLKTPPPTEYETCICNLPGLG